MRQYFLKTAAAATALALFATGSFAQDENKDNKENTRRHSEDMIIITPKASADTKLTIEIKGDAVTINGKPMAEFRSDDVNVSKRKQMRIESDNMMRLSDMDAMNAPRSKFRVRPDASYSYSYGNPGSINSNKAFLGVGTQKQEEGEGVEVTSVTDESAAEKAGLKEGDIITKINDSKVNSPEELTKTIGKFNPNDKINITYKRNKKEQKATAALTKRKGAEVFSFRSDDMDLKKNFNYDFKLAPFARDNFSIGWDKPRLGLKAQETEDGKGLKVLDVDDESAAEKAGIKEGDIITTFDGIEVNNIDVLRDLSRAAIEKGNFKVNLTRDGKAQEVTVKIPKNLKSGSL